VVITEVDPNSNAADKGLKTGDVILQVAGETVSQPGDVAKGVKSASGALGRQKDRHEAINILR
jgi:serine protease Do